MSNRLLGFAAISGGGPLVCLAALGLTLAACGPGGQRTATQTRQPFAATLRADIGQAFRSASSFHMSGRLIYKGRPISFDVGLLRSGQLSGTISEQDLPLQVIATSRAAYLKITPALLRYWHAPSVACHIVCGKYVRLPTTRAALLLHGLRLRLSKLESGFAARVPPLSKDGTAVVDGQKVYVLRSARGDTFDVATTGSHYPVAFSASGGFSQVHFSQWNRVPVPSAPPPGLIANLNGIG